MTVSTDTRRVQYATNGTTGPFTVTFPFLEDTHLEVTHTDSSGVETLLTLNVGYTVAGASIELSTAYPAGGVITIDRAIPITQELDLRDGDEFPAESVERALDKLTMLAQQIALDGGRVLRVPEVSANLPDLPPIADRAGRLLGFDSNGDPVGTLPTAGDATALALDLLNTSLAAKGDALIGVKRTETGGVATTQHAVNQERPWYPVPDSGATGDDTADDTAELQAALDASLFVDLGDARRKYKISAALTLRPGHIIRANGAEIRQVTNNTEIFNAETRSDITIMGVIGRGVGTDYTDSDSSRSVFLYCGTSGSRIQVYFCKLYGFSYTTVRAKANSHVWFGHNYVEGPGSPTLTAVTSGRCYGFLADAGCADVFVFGNHLTKCAQGVRIEQVSRFSVTDNDIFDITGQHGVYLGTGLSDGVIGGNRINDVDLIGIKLQAQNATTDNRRLVIKGNTITACGDQGILTCNGAGSTSQTQKNRGVTIKGNVIRTTAGTGINVQNTIGAVVIGNTVDGAAFSGISLSASSRVTVAKNIVENCGQSGIRDEAASTQILVLRNQVRDCATANAVGDEYGILVQDMTEWSLVGNIISDASANMQYGIYCAGGDQTTVVIQDNQVLNATDAGLRMKNATDAARIYRGNLWTGTLAPVFNEPAMPTVASAATITLPQGNDIVYISGTTGITSINAAGHAGRTVRLVFLAALTVTDGSNLRLNGNFVTTADDVLTLSCDGANWYENGRSAN